MALGVSCSDFHRTSNCNSLSSRCKLKPWQETWLKCVTQQADLWVIRQVLEIGTGYKLAELITCERTKLENMCCEKHLCLTNRRLTFKRVS